MPSSPSHFVALVGVALVSVSYLLFYSPHGKDQVALSTEKLQIRKLVSVKNAITEPDEKMLDTETMELDRNSNSLSGLNSTQTLAQENPYTNLKQKNNNFTTEELRNRRSQNLNNYLEKVVASQFHPFLVPDTSVKSQISDDTQSTFDPYRQQKSNNLEHPKLKSSSDDNNKMYLDTVFQLNR